AVTGPVFHLGRAHPAQFSWPYDSCFYRWLVCRDWRDDYYHSRTRHYGDEPLAAAQLPVARASRYLPAAAVAAAHTDRCDFSRRLPVLLDSRQSLQPHQSRSEEHT